MYGKRKLLDDDDDDDDDDEDGDEHVIKDEDGNVIDPDDIPPDGLDEKELEQWKQNREKQRAEAAEKAAERARIEAEEKKKKDAEMAAAREEAFKTFNRRVISAQAVMRGAIQRIRWEDRKVEVFASIQLLQNYLRRILAKLKTNDLRRKRKMFLFMAEEEETHLMWRQDQFSQLYRTLYNAALLIQRIFRGHRGRIKAAIDAYEITRFGVCRSPATVAA